MQREMTAKHRRGLMNEAVKIGSYEDYDYYGNGKSSSFSQLLKFIASKLRILPSSNPFRIPELSVLVNLPIDNLSIIVIIFSRKIY